jgi:NADH-quinone oxidoreductase subunit C
MSIQEIIEKFASSNHFALTSNPVQEFIGYIVPADKIVDLLQFLKKSEDLRFTILTDLFASDFPEKEKRFEVVYNLLSLKLNKRLILKVEITEDEAVDSATEVYAAAGWYEREAFDMFGMVFTGNPDMRRILTDYGFKGHPLRKDFPLTGHLQIKYDDKLEKVIYEPVLLEQEFRNFDFVSPWRGPGEYVLPGDEKASK